MNRDLANLIQEAHRLDREGRREEAARAYVAFLKHQPKSAAAWGDYGGLLMVSGKLEQAGEACRRALSIDPADPGARINLGCLLVRRGLYEEAEGHFRRVLAKDPSRNDVRLALADGLMKKGDLDSAREVLERALARDPIHLDAHRLLCRILVQKGEQSAVFQEVLRRFTALGAGSSAEARLEVSNLSLLFGSMPQGWEQYESRLELPVARPPQGERGPAHWEGQPFPGKTLLVEWERDPADFQMYLRYAPLVKALGGRVVWQVERPLADMATHCPDIDEVCLMEDEPPRFDLRVSMGSLPWLFKVGHARVPPGSPYDQQPLPLGMLAPPQAHPDHPRWKGEPFEGKTLLVDWEQGLGDTLMFIRYAPMVKALGGRVIWSVQRAVAEVVATCQGVDEVIPSGDPLPAFDLYVPLLSLPWMFRTDLTTIPAEVPYLHVPRLVPNRAQLTEVLDRSAGKLRIGLAWSGNPVHKRNSDRSMPVELLAPLAALPEVAWYSFQFEAAEAPLLPGLEGFGALLKGFSNTAYAVSRMDLVITIDTVVAHLAGALGVPTFLVLHAFPDWRWLLGREDSPWYPTLRIYRQPTAGDWASAVQRMILDLTSQDAFP